MDRADVAGVVTVCLDAAGTADPVRCDAASVAPPSLPAVDAIAQIALVVRRDGRSFRLDHASPELIQLLDLCGLAECLALPDDDGSPP